MSAQELGPGLGDVDNASHMEVHQSVGLAANTGTFPQAVIRLATHVMLHDSDNDDDDSQDYGKYN